MAFFITQKQQNRYNDMITKCLKQRMRGTHCPVVVVVVVVAVVVVHLCADVCSLLSSALEQQTFLQIKVNHMSLYCILFLYCNIHMKSATKMVLIKQTLCLSKQK
jgi:hypothetical protein